MPLFGSMGPLSIIDFPVCPCVHTSSIRFPLVEVAVITVLISISFKSFAVTLVILPAALVLATVLVAHHSLPFALSVHELPAVELVVLGKALFFVVWLRNQPIHVYFS